jgi:hypothetical protein
MTICDYEGYSGTMLSSNKERVLVYHEHAYYQGFHYAFSNGCRAFFTAVEAEAMIHERGPGTR